MVVFFCAIVLVLIAFTKRLAATWVTFEAEDMDSMTNLSGFQRDYKNGYLKFMQSMQAYGYPASLGVRFSDYLTKMIRRYMVKLSSLSWTVWICVATFVMLSAIRTEVTRTISQLGVENVQSLSQEQKFGNYMSFIVFQGYVVLGAFLFLFWSLRRRLAAFLKGTRSAYSGGAAHTQGPDAPMTSSTRDAPPSVDTLDDPRNYLFRRSVESTLLLLQITLICLEWYTATFSVSFIIPIYDSFPVHTMVVLYVVAAGPLVIIPLLPRTLMMLSMMSSLGTNLDEVAVQYFIRKANIPPDELPAKMRKAPVVPRRAAVSAPDETL
jgi:hypothetical protein